MIPKVEIEAGKADLIREILGVNDLQDINLLDEYIYKITKVCV